MRGSVSRWGGRGGEGPETTARRSPRPRGEPAGGESAATRSCEVDEQARAARGARFTNSPNPAHAPPPLALGEGPGEGGREGEGGRGWEGREGMGGQGGEG